MKNLKKSFLFFFVLFICLNKINSFAQQRSDSLFKYYSKSKETNKSIEYKLIAINKLINLSKSQNNNKYLLKGYNRKSYLYYKLKKYDSAIITAKLLLDKSVILKDTLKILLAYKKLADYNRHNDNLLLSIKNYKKHKNFNLSNKDTLSIIKDLRFIASLQNILGFQFESETNAIEALKLVDRLKTNTKKEIKIKLGLYNQLGILYKELNNYDKALELFDKALMIATEQNNINTILNNKANIYIKQNKFEKAINEFENLYLKTLKSKNKLKIAQVLNNLGTAQSKINNPKALSNLLTALKIRVKEKSDLGKYSSYINLATYYKERNDSKKVLFYATKAYNIASKIKSSSDKVEALSFIVAIDNNNKIVEYKTLTDSITKARQANANKYAAMKYDYTEKEKLAKESEIKLKNSEIKQAKERFYKFIYLTIGILLLLISLFTFFIQKSKTKKEKLKQVYITETRISQKVHDEVANDVYGIITKLQTNENQNIEILDDLERVYNKTRDISKENSIINFSGDFSTILQDLLTSYKNDKVNVITRNLNKMDWSKVSKLKKTTIYRVLQELMTNMKKHSKASATVITFNKKNQKIHINYKDNGIGCKINKNTGLQNTENRIQSVNGSITFESQINKGFEVKITI